MARSENIADLLEILEDQEINFEDLPDAETILELYKEEQKKFKEKSQKAQKKAEKRKLDKDVRVLLISDDDRYIDSTH